jgi:TolA-binding protein
MKKILVCFCTLLLVSTGVILRAQETDKTASETGSESSDLERVSDDVRYENASDLLKLKKKDKALALFGEYLELFPEGAHRKEVLRSIGDIYLERSDYSRAIKYYQQLYEEYGNEDEGIAGFFQTAICYSRMGNTDKAVEIYKGIIERYPSSPYSAKAKNQLDIEEMVK